MKGKNSGRSLNQVGINLCKGVFCGKHIDEDQNQNIDGTVSYLDDDNNNVLKAINNNK